MANSKKLIVQNLRSNVTANGGKTPKLPTISNFESEYGVMGINYGEGFESLSTLNSNNKVVAFNYNLKLNNGENIFDANSALFEEVKLAKSITINNEWQITHRAITSNEITLIGNYLSDDKTLQFVKVVINQTSKKITLTTGSENFVTDLTNYYNKGEVDTKLTLKADKTDISGVAGVSAGDGIEVRGTSTQPEVWVKIDESDNENKFLTCSVDGLKLSGVQTAIDGVKIQMEEIERVTAVSLTNIKNCVGIDSEGKFTLDGSTETNVKAELSNLKDSVTSVNSEVDTVKSAVENAQSTADTAKSAAEKAQSDVDTLENEVIKNEQTIVQTFAQINKSVGLDEEFKFVLDGSETTVKDEIENIRTLVSSNKENAQNAKNTAENAQSTADTAKLLVDELRAESDILLSYEFPENGKLAALFKSTTQIDADNDSAPEITVQKSDTTEYALAKQLMSDLKALAQQSYMVNGRIRIQFGSSFTSYFDVVNVKAEEFVEEDGTDRVTPDLYYVNEGGHRKGWHYTYDCDAFYTTTLPHGYKYATGGAYASSSSSGLMSSTQYIKLSNIENYTNDNSKEFSIVNSETITLPGRPDTSNIFRVLTKTSHKIKLPSKLLHRKYTVMLLNPTASAISVDIKDIIDDYASSAEGYLTCTPSNGTLSIPEYRLGEIIFYVTTYNDLNYIAVHMSVL